LIEQKDQTIPGPPVFSNCGPPLGEFVFDLFENGLTPARIATRNLSYNCSNMQNLCRLEAPVRLQIARHRALAAGIGLKRF
jgi:hypothetical protein